MRLFICLQSKHSKFDLFWEKKLFKVVKAGLLQTNTSISLQSIQFQRTTQNQSNTGSHQTVAHPINDLTQRMDESFERP